MEEQITIAAKPEDVFSYVSDFTRHGEWSGHGLQVSKTSDGPIAPGSTFATVAKLYGTQRENSTITEVSPPSRFSWESVGSLGRVRHWFAIEGGDGSTTLTKGAEFVKAKLLAKIMMGKIRKDMPESFRSDLAKIKATMEDSAAQRPA